MPSPSQPAQVKTCTSCGTAKPLDAFNRKHNGYRSGCRACQKLDDRRYRLAKMAEDPHYVRRKHLKTKYKLTLEGAEALYALRDYRCEACGVHQDETFHGALALDHDHACCPSEFTCGKCIRGVLCIPCNVAFGALRDSLTRVEELAAYARKVANATPE